jgi:hypothetical protein
MANSSGSSSRQGSPPAPLEPPEKIQEEGPAGGNRNLLGAAPSGRDFRFGDAPANLGGRERGPARMSEAPPVMAVDDTVEKLRALRDQLRGEHRVRLPYATPLPSIPGLRAASANKGVPSRLAIHSDQRWATMLHRPRRSLSEPMALLLASTLILVLCAGIVATSWPPATDVSDAPRLPPNETRRATLVSSPQTGEFEARTTASAARDEPEITVHSDDKPIGSETGSAGERSTATGATSTLPGSGSVHQASQESSATAVLDVRDAKPVIEAEAKPLADFTCYPSAPAVRQDHWDAWPSWTLRAPGHEGIRCWYATTRAAAHDRRRLATP